MYNKLLKIKNNIHKYKSTIYTSFFLLAHVVYIFRTYIYYVWWWNKKFNQNRRKMWNIFFLLPFCCHSLNFTCVYVKNLLLFLIFFFFCWHMNNNILTPCEMNKKNYCTSENENSPQKKRIIKIMIIIIYTLGKIKPIWKYTRCFEFVT